MSTAETAIVVEHALSSRQNLGLAIDVALAYGEIRTKLLTDGMKEVERLVGDGMGTEGVRIDNGFAKDPLDLWVGFYVRRDAWLPGAHVGLQAQTSNARNVILGIWRDQAITTGNMPTTASLSEALGKPGKASQTWPWYNPLDAKYRHWDAKEALLAFGPSPDKPCDAAAYLSERILGVVTSVDGLLTT